MSECDDCGKEIFGKDCYGGCFGGRGPWCFLCNPERYSKACKFLDIAKNYINDIPELSCFYFLMAFIYWPNLIVND